MSNTLAASLRQRMSGLARQIGTGLTLGALVFAAACSSDRFTAPTPDVHAANGAVGNVVSTVTTSGNSLIHGNSLMRTVPLARSITRSITVASGGGSISIPEAGVTLSIPGRAIGNRTMTITMTAMAGSAVAYTFEPHGVQFYANLKLTQNLERTTWFGNTGRVTLGGGYFARDNQVNTSTGRTLLNELLPAELTGGRVHLNIRHFSGYMVSMD